MNKTDLLFQMMEQPHAYTDQQWQDSSGRRYLPTKSAESFTH